MSKPRPTGHICARLSSSSGPLDLPVLSVSTCTFHVHHTVATKSNRSNMTLVFLRNVCGHLHPPHHHHHHHCPQHFHGAVGHCFCSVCLICPPPPPLDKARTPPSCASFFLSLGVSVLQSFPPSRSPPTLSRLLSVTSSLSASSSSLQSSE